jgi:hypothetical protein
MDKRLVARISRTPCKEEGCRKENANICHNARKTASRAFLASGDYAYNSTSPEVVIVVRLISEKAEATATFTRTCGDLCKELRFLFVCVDYFRQGKIAP